MNTMIKGEKVKKINFGFLVSTPKEGESVILVQDGKTLKTSPVEKVVSYYSDTVWVVETRNSIYMLSKAG